MELDLQSLGMTEQELQERVIQTIANNLMKEKFYRYEDCEEEEMPKVVKRKLTEILERRIDAGLDALFTKYVLPDVETYLEDLVIQRTNNWGERKGEPIKFVEHLHNKAVGYMAEDVNAKGKTKAEQRYDRFERLGSRAQWMIRTALDKTMKEQIEDAMKRANEAITGGLAGAVKAALEKELGSYSVTIATKK